MSLPIPPLRMPRYNENRRSSPDFYDPYMIAHGVPPPIYHNKMMHKKSSIARHHPYHPHSYRK